MIWNEVVCLGDSLTYGARDRYGRSYPAELAKILFEKIQASALNCKKLIVIPHQHLKLLNISQQLDKTLK